MIRLPHILPSTPRPATPRAILARHPRTIAPRRRTGRPSFATLIVLWVSAIAAVVVVAVQRSALSEAVGGREAMARVRAYWAARAGVESVVAKLEYATLNPDTSGAYTIIDDLSSVSTGKLDGALYDISHDDANGIRVPGPLDAHARINVNLMTRDSLLTLPGMTEDMADSILDWIDEDDDSNPLGAEIGYYLAQAYSYEPRNSFIRSLEELELVAGVDPVLVRGEDWNLNGLLDANEDDGDESWPPDNADGKLDSGWSGIITAASSGDNLAASGEARLDLSTASEGDVSSRTKADGDQSRAIINYVQNYAGGTPAMRDFIRQDLRQLDDMANGIQGGGRGAGGGQGGQQRSRVASLTPEQIGLLLDECSIGEVVPGYTPGKLNLNTCDAQTLEYLPNIDPALADTILFERESRPEGFVSVADLLGVPGLGRNRVAALADVLTVKSNGFVVTCRGRDARSGVEVELQVTLDRSTVPLVIQEVVSR